MNVDRLERLAQPFDGIAPELREFIEGTGRREVPKRSRMYTEARGRLRSRPRPPRRFKVLRRGVRAGRRTLGGENVGRR